MNHFYHHDERVQRDAVVDRFTAYRRRSRRSRARQRRSSCITSDDRATALVDRSWQGKARNGPDLHSIATIAHDVLLFALCFKSPPSSTFLFRKHALAIAAAATRAQTRSSMADDVVNAMLRVRALPSLPPLCPRPPPLPLLRSTLSPLPPPLPLLLTLPLPSRGRLNHHAAS